METADLACERARDAGSRNGPEQGRIRRSGSRSARQETHDGICGGNGKRTRFWYDVWVGQDPLKILFHSLFRAAKFTDSAVDYEMGSYSFFLENGCVLLITETYS
jgi:hypothetical protein